MIGVSWEKVDARLMKRVRVNKDTTHDGKRRNTVEVWDCTVELPGPDGVPTHLVIRAKSFKVELPDEGKTVPVLVNKQRTEAKFDLDDPRISLDARRKLGKDKKKRRDAEKRQSFYDRFRS